MKVEFGLETGKLNPQLCPQRYDIHTNEVLHHISDKSWVKTVKGRMYTFYIRLFYSPVLRRDRSGGGGAILKKGFLEK